MSAPIQPIIRLPLPDLPRSCGYCGHEAAEWPLAVYGGQVNVTCPACFSVVAPVVAVAEGAPHCSLCGAVERVPAHTATSNYNGGHDFIPR